MARKVKCEEDEMLSWFKIAQHGQKIQPDASKITVAQMKKAIDETLQDPKGCVTKPKGVGRGEMFKSASEWYRGAQTKTGKKWKELVPK